MCFKGFFISFIFFHLREPHQYADNAKGVKKIARSFNSLQKTIQELSNKP
jgi:hypothetical protein